MVFVKTEKQITGAARQWSKKNFNPYSQSPPSTKAVVGSVEKEDK